MPPPVKVPLPHAGWSPRPYQRPLWRYLLGGGRRGIAAWHRRSGKDEVALHWACIAAMERVGTYWHLLPQQNQARRSIWEAVNPRTGKKRIADAFPAALIAKKREQDMSIELINGSTWQVLGSDNYDALVGSPPIGVVFSEYALSDPRAWAFTRPILAENDGWALFISTVRGRNHFASLLRSARETNDWFAEILPADKTGVFTPERLEQERAEMLRENGVDVGESLFRQEYLCDLDAPVLGSYYAREITAAERDGRITRVPWQPGVPVVTAWDIGRSDSTVIWIAQRVGREFRILDCIEGSGRMADHYAAELAKLGLPLAETYLPHDAGHDTFIGENAAAQLRKLGLPKITVLPQDDIDVGIAAVRKMLPACVFNASKLEGRPLDALRSYKRQWNEKNKAFANAPLHDWTSHFADAFRYLALAFEAGAGRQASAGRVEVVDDWNPYGR